MSIPENTLINDIRTSSNFKGITLSGYKKTEVKKHFIENMLKGKIEPSCYWCAELICAGHFSDVWECILYFVGKHIHVANPKIIIYLDKRMQIFSNIIQQGHFTSELQLRNNLTIRKLFAEIITIITLSPKKNSFETIKINRIEEFDITQMTDRFKAPNITFIENIIMPEDPKELIVAINEFAFQISNNKPNMLLACYWIEWIIEFDIICKKRKEPCLCQRRKNEVEHKYQRDIIWMIWDTLIYYSSKLNPQNLFIENLMKSLKNIFITNYTTGCCKKRKYLLYYAVELLTEHVPTNIELITEKEILKNVNDKINDVYKQIKKNEESPNTDYLFSGLNSNNNFEKSIQKMDMLNSMSFVPRNE